SNENGGRKEYDTAPRSGQPDHSGNYNSSNNGRGGGSGSGYSSENGGSKEYDSGPRYSKADPPKLSGPPPGYNDRDARRRVASPTHSEMGRDEGGKGEDRWSYNQRNGNVDDDRQRGSGKGGGNAGSISRPAGDRPRGGGGVFGSRAVTEPQQQPQSSRAAVPQGRGVFSKAPTMVTSVPIPSQSSRVYQTSNLFTGDDEEVYSAHQERLQQRRQRDQQNFDEKGSRREERWRERERSRGRLLTPPREGKGEKQEKKRLEDRLNPEFGGPSGSSRTVSGGFWNSGSMPEPMAVPERPHRDPSPPHVETPEEKDERQEDEKIARSVRFLPRGSFDDDVQQMFEKWNPRVTPIFRPYLFSASVQSGGVPLHPEKEEYYEDKVRQMNR
ncbi:hypothetical protein PENTCL1PPCAC_7331, partial [Pristionchus entomophagus]